MCMKLFRITILLLHQIMYLMYFNTSYIFFVIMHILIKELICRLGVFHVHMCVLCKQNVGNYQSNNFSSSTFFYNFLIPTKYHSCRTFIFWLSPSYFSTFPVLSSPSTWAPGSVILWLLGNQISYVTKQVEVRLL